MIFKKELLRLAAAFVVTLLSLSFVAEYFGITVLAEPVNGNPVVLSVDNSFSENEAGYYYVNMPKGEKDAPATDVLSLSDTSITSFMIYDDGGKGGGYESRTPGNYSVGANGYLLIDVPTGYKVHLSGYVRTGSDRSFLTVYDGNSTDASTLCENIHGTNSSAYANDYYRVTIDVTSTGEYVLLHLDASEESKGWDTEGLIITATIEPVDYSVSFNSNAAESVNGTMATQSFTYDEGAKKLTDNAYARTGYTFGGWATSADGDAVYADSQEVENLSAKNGDTVELFAKWIPIDYAITTQADKGSVTAMLNNTSVSFAHICDEILLQITPDENYQLDSLTVVKADDETVTYPVNNTNGTWSFSMPAENVIVNATFKLIQKTVSFVNEDGTEILSITVDINSVPSYSGENPTKDKDAQYTYTFAGWKDSNNNTYGPTEALPAVTDDVTYTANFDATVNKYTIKFVNEDGTELQSGTVEYGTIPSYSGATPTKAEDDQYTYTFSGWTPVIVPVTGDATYTATFTETAKPIPAVTSGIAHVQDIGNVTTYADEETGFLYLGTEGQCKRLESITLYFDNPTEYSGTLEYRVHVQDIGWTDWVTAGNPAGTTGQAKRIEAIEIRLTGELADNYSVFYGVHIQDYGDMQGWVQDGALAGTTGESKRIEALAVVIVPKGMEDNISVQYRVHVQDYGWESSYASDGKMAGTSGQSKRLEGIEMFLTGCPYSGGIQYKTHIQDIGWESGWTKNGEMSGTQGQSKRLEGICIELYGEVAEYYDIYYRVHAQDIGWMAWAKNGECAGTAGRSARLEGIQIVLVPKGDPAPSATYEGITSVTEKAFIEGF